MTHVLLVTCTCEKRIVTATEEQIYDGRPITCGRPDCPGEPPPGGVPRRGGRPRKPIHHGTAAGYSAHRHQGIPPCQDCKSAHTEARRLRLRRKADA